METYTKERKENVEKDFIRKGLIEQRQRERVKKEEKGEDNIRIMWTIRSLTYTYNQNTHKRLVDSPSLSNFSLSLYSDFLFYFDIFNSSKRN